MARIIKPEVAQDLSDLFIPQESVALSPDSLSSEVMLTHNLLPGTHKFRSAFSPPEIAGAAGVLIAAALVVPADRYWYVIAASAFHNDPATRNVRLEILSPSGQGIALTNQIALATNIRLALSRSLLLPPGVFLRAVTDAIAAASQIFLDLFYVEHRILDPHPTR